MKGLLNFLSFHLPGHTHDHLAYRVFKNIEGDTNDKQNSLLFSGDVLFGMGCGRIFEGTYDQMLMSLKRVASLPANTLVFCSHEYTEANLAFTLLHKPYDDKIRRRQESIRARRASGYPTVPLLLEEEKDTNIFLRALASLDSLGEFQHWRGLRNSFNVTVSKE